MSFEYQVPPNRGRGKASHSDLMIGWDRAAAAIEAKWTEPEYELVSEWLGAKPTRNRKEVLSG
jgi:hypothetical protein